MEGGGRGCGGVWVGGMEGVCREIEGIVGMESLRVYSECCIILTVIYQEQYRYIPISGTISVCNVFRYQVQYRYTMSVNF